MKKEYDLKNLDIGNIVLDKEIYNNFVYTSLREAVIELRVRRDDKELEKKVSLYLHDDIPEPLEKDFKAVLYRQLITPNYEFRRFMEMIKEVGLEPMFFEYPDDKFTSINPLKHSLGKMKFQISDIDKHKKSRVESKNVVDFNICEGKKINELKTWWGQSLVDFHHGLLQVAYPGAKKFIFDASAWFHRGGDNAKRYYAAYLALFIRNGILFENFLPEGGELKFVSDVFLPSFIEVWKNTGRKPLIVNILPFESQSDGFWTSHPIQTLDRIKDSIKNGKVL